MKQRFPIIAVLLLSLAMANAAAASLIGDEVTVQYIENNAVREQRTFTVSEQNENIVIGETTMRLNIQADTISVDFVRFNSFPDSFSTFFGIRVLDLDWDNDNPDWILLGAEVTNNTMTSADLWYTEEDQRLLIDPIAGGISFDWNMMSYDRNQNFTAMLEFGPNPIPIPATLALFVTGLIGFIIVRRKKKG